MQQLAVSKLQYRDSNSRKQTESERQKEVVKVSNSKNQTNPECRRELIKGSNSKTQTEAEHQKVGVKISNLKNVTDPKRQKVVVKISNSKTETDPKRQKVVFKASNSENQTEPESHKVTVKGSNSKKQIEPEGHRVAVKGSNSENQTDLAREKVLQALEDFHDAYMKATGGRRDMTALNSTNKISLTGKDTDNLGPIPGVKVGDTFKYRAELTLLGLHKHLRAGVSFKKPDNTPRNSKTKTVVTSVVATERVDKMALDKNTLIYTGLGGIKRKPSRLKNGKKIHLKYQTLDGANLALLNSINRDPVRVIYGHEVEKRGTKEKEMVYTFYGMFYVTGKIEKEVIVKEEDDEKSYVNYEFKLERVNRDEVVETRVVSRV